MEKALENMGLNFKKQFPHGPYTADFAIPESNLIIECDGHWHSLPDVQKRDRKRDNYFWRNGWRTMRFTKEQILSDIESCVSTIKRHLA